MAEPGPPMDVCPVTVGEDGLPRHVDGDTINYSVSAAGTFRDCQRKWWMGSVERQRTSSQSTEDGTAIHDLLERYLTGQVDPKDIAPGHPDYRYWRLVEPALEYLPSPSEVGTGVWGVETRVGEGLFVGPLPLKGFVDLHLLEPEHPLIIDHKSTKDKGFRWAKSESSLRTFPQPNVYTWALYDGDPPPLADFAHLNICSSTPKAMMVWARDVTRAEVLEVVAREEKTARDMYEAALKYKHADEVPTNPGACSMFGGCKYAEWCPASPLNRTTPVASTTTTKEPTMSNDKKKTLSLQERIAAIQNKQKQSTETPEPKTTQVSEDVQGAAEYLLSKFEGKESMPVAAAKVLAKANGGGDFDAVLEAAGLEVSGGKVVRKEATDRSTDFINAIEVGMPTSEAVALAKTMGIGQEYVDLLGKAALRSYSGMLVPQDWEGTPSEARVELLGAGDEVDHALAETLVDGMSFREFEATANEVGADPFIAMALRGRWRTLHGLIRDPEVLATSDVAQALEDAKTSPNAQAGEVSEEDNVATATAAMLDALKQAGGEMKKTDANAIIAGAVPSWGRVSKKRWEAIVEASLGCIEYGAKVKLLVDEEEEPEVPEEEPEVPEEEPEVPEEEPEVPEEEPEVPEEETEDEETEDEETEVPEEEPEDEDEDEEYGEGYADGYAVGFDEGRSSAEAAEAEGSPSEGFTVFLGCRPRLSEVTDIDVFLRPLYAQVEADLRIDDWQAEEYGKGAKAVAGVLAAQLRANGPDDVPDLYIPSWHPAARQLATVFMRFDFIEVIRGDLVQ